MFGKAGIAGLMKQMQHTQDKMKQAQEELADVEVVGVAGSGMVKVTMTCHNVVKRIQLDDHLVGEAKDDKEMLEDLIATAINDAVRKAEETTQTKMAGFTQGMALPPGLGGLFK